jgi:2-(acetamidomethylene)succinate hydrolase
MATRPYQTHDVHLPAGHTLRVYEWPGTGPSLALLLLHGSGSYGLQWEWVADHLDGRFRVLAPDQRGHGDSGRPDGEYSAEEYADDIHHLVEALALDRVIVAGNSLGGRVAQVFAARYPHQCAAAVVLALHLSNFSQDRERMAAVLRSACAMLNAPTEFASREEALAYLTRTRGDRETPASLEHRIDHSMERDGAGYRVKHDPVRVAQGLAHMATNLRPYTAAVKCPVLIVRSTMDSEVSAEQATEIASLWREGQTVDVAGGYLLYVQNPAGTAAAITAFVDRVSPTAASVTPADGVG